LQKAPKIVKTALFGHLRLKESDMKDRIKKLMDSQHMTQRLFAQYTGISEASLSGVLNDKNKPTLNMVMALKSRFPTLSLEWLIDGKGPMFMEGSASDTGSQESVGSSQEGNVREPVLDFSSSLPMGQSADKGSQAGNPYVVQPKNMVNLVDKKERKVTEIRIFYDDQTWESFVPKK
jgi:transcriptional regulator with XRE-family HTH domain